MVQGQSHRGARRTVRQANEMQGSVVAKSTPGRDRKPGDKRRCGPCGSRYLKSTPSVNENGWVCSLPDSLVPITPLPVENPWQKGSSFITLLPTVTQEQFFG